MSKTQDGPMDGATRQARFKERMRKEGRRRMEIWVTDEQRKHIAMYDGIDGVLEALRDYEDEHVRG